MLAITVRNMLEVYLQTAYLTSMDGIPPLAAVQQERPMYGVTSAVKHRSWLSMVVTHIVEYVSL